MENKLNKKENIKKQRIKEANFVNTTEIREEIINNFYKFYKFRVNRFDFYSFLICGVVLIIIAINLLLNSDNFFGGIIFNLIISIILFSLSVCFFISSFTVQKYDKKRMKKIYDEDISKMSIDFYFDNDKIVIVNKYGETERVYAYLEAIYEAKDFYYIFTAKKNAHIMKKDSFTKGNEEEFNKFIKEKMGKKYKKRCIRRKTRE